MALDPGSMHGGRGRGRSREMMGRGGAVNRMVVDHRPRALAILGVTQEEKEELMPHFVVRSSHCLQPHDDGAFILILILILLLLCRRNLGRSRICVTRMQTASS